MGRVAKIEFTEEEEKVKVGVGGELLFLTGRWVQISRGAELAFEIVRQTLAKTLYC